MWLLLIGITVSYGLNLKNLPLNMENTGFTNLKRVENDPLNSMWLGQKRINSVLKISTLNKKVTFSNAVRCSI